MAAADRRHKRLLIGLVRTFEHGDSHGPNWSLLGWLRVVHEWGSSNQLFARARIAALKVGMQWPLPLWVIVGPQLMLTARLLHPRKRTCRARLVMLQKGQNQTQAVQQTK